MVMSDHEYERKRAKIAAKKLHEYNTGKVKEHGVGLQPEHLGYLDSDNAAMRKYRYEKHLGEAIKEHQQPHWKQD